MTDSDSPDGKRIVGFKQSLKAIKSNKVKYVYLACDASVEIVNPIIKACEDVGISSINREHTMMQLGNMANIDVQASVIVVLK